MFLAKYTDNGSTFANSWVVSNGGTFDDLGYGVAVSGNSVYVAGFFTSFAGTIISGQSLNGAGGSDLFVAKYTDNSATVANAWARSSGGGDNDRCDGIAVNGSNIYVSGRFPSGSSAFFAGNYLTGQGGIDAVVYRYVDNGCAPTAGSSVSAGGTGDDIGYIVAADASNVYVTVGTGNAPTLFGNYTAPANTAVLGKLDAGSAFGTWQRVAYPIILSQGSGATAVVADASGNMLVTGYFASIANFGSTQLVSAGGYDVFLAKWNTSTSTWAWAVRAGRRRRRSVAVSNGNVYVCGDFVSNTGTVIAGTSLTGAGGTDVFLVKYTDAGSTATSGWAVSGGGTDYDYGRSVAVSGTNVYLPATPTMAAPSPMAGPPPAAAPATTTWPALPSVATASTWPAPSSAMPIARLPGAPLPGRAAPMRTWPSTLTPVVRPRACGPLLAAAPATTTPRV
jgi:hypothetical protein